MFLTHSPVSLWFLWYGFLIFNYNTLFASRSGNMGWDLWRPKEITQMESKMLLEKHFTGLFFVYKICTLIYSWSKIIQLLYLFDYVIAYVKNIKMWLIVIFF